MGAEYVKELIEQMTDKSLEEAARELEMQREAQQNEDGVPTIDLRNLETEEPTGD